MLWLKESRNGSQLLISRQLVVYICLGQKVFEG